LGSLVQTLFFRSQLALLRKINRNKKGQLFTKVSKVSFEPKGLSIAPKTLANFLERKTQLYEQGADHSRIGLYVRNL
jgi:hypothetical protein